jgi:flagellar motor protein MotB
VVTEGLGTLRPLDPNTKPDGSDNPEGRSRNRRTEIFLDF